MIKGDMLLTADVFIKSIPHFFGNFPDSKLQNKVISK